MYICKVEYAVRVLDKWVTFSSMIECKDLKEIDSLKEAFADKVVEIVREIND